MSHYLNSASQRDQGIAGRRITWSQGTHGSMASHQQTRYGRGCGEVGQTMGEGWSERQGCDENRGPEVGVGLSKQSFTKWGKRVGHSMM